MSTLGAFPHLTCPKTGKQVFGTLGRADHYRAKVEQTVKAAPGTYRVYQCPWCGWWHLTSARRRGLL